MRVTARGWGKDHGQKDIIGDNIEKAPVRSGTFWHSDDKAQLQILSSARDLLFYPKAVISMGARLTLSGHYVVQVELNRIEIARLFYLTHREFGLDGLIGMFARLKDEQEKEEEAEREAEKVRNEKPVVRRR